MMLSKKQRQSAVLQKLSGFKSALSDASSAVGALVSEAGPLVFGSEKLEAESASYYEAFDPLKHGADAQRAEAKIKERERIMQSMKGGFADEHDGPYAD
mmetsp:Transcript_7430/g.21982  ORF Transcript_7430/g.21982 Transcript_7430/m.21982 type:complete len:99 (-) Transcript_7430:116-412(-)